MDHNFSISFSICDCLELFCAVHEAKYLPEIPSTSSEDNLSENLKNEEEEFEIPAFLRKQKF